MLSKMISLRVRVIEPDGKVTNMTAGEFVIAFQLDGEAVTAMVSALECFGAFIYGTARVELVKP